LTKKKKKQEKKKEKIVKRDGLWKGSYGSGAANASPGLRLKTNRREKERQEGRELPERGNTTSLS